MSQDEEDRMRQAFREHVASGPSLLNEEAFMAAWRGSKGRPRLDDHLDRFDFSADPDPDWAEKLGAQKSTMTISGSYTRPRYPDTFIRVDPADADKIRIGATMQVGPDAHLIPTWQPGDEPLAVMPYEVVEQTEPGLFRMEARPQ